MRIFPPNGPGLHARSSQGPENFISVEHPAGLLRVRVARRFLQRATGLLATRALPADQGLLLVPCWSIHTFGMHYAIDALFLDSDARILQIRRLSPWRIAACRYAHAVLELMAGGAERAALQCGDELPELRRWLLHS